MTNPRPEYPRPHFDRSHSWSSCNGVWDFAGATAQIEDGSAEPAALCWDRSITVPFGWDSAASGIGLPWLSEGAYRRRVDVPPQWQGRRIVLHFGAVHHRATVWVDGTEVGSHTGGYLPFEFDITDALKSDRPTVVVTVSAPVDKREIAHGKQRSVPRDDYDDCAFAPSAGMWQSVWLEARPETYLESFQLRPSADLRDIEVSARIAGAFDPDSTLDLTLVEDGSTLSLTVSGADLTATLPVAAPKLWALDEGHLYHVRARLSSPAGVDEVTAYTGLRSIDTSGSELRLNGERLFVRGVLDQGYWPSTGITAPTDQAYVTDLRLAREAGFNVVRKHLKTEDPRFLYHADRMGILVWAEPASTGRFSAASVDAFEEQIAPMVERDGNHPSIVIWGLYNEEWGLDWDVPNDPTKRDAVSRAYRLIKGLDPSRPAVDNSGWAHVRTDLMDWHIYTSDPTAWRGVVDGVATGELTAFPVHIAPGVVVTKTMMATDEEHPLVPNLNSEFGGGFTSAQRGWNLRWQTQEFRRHDVLSGYVYTELYDIEHEMAGIYTADRRHKDLGGTDPALANAETTLVLNVNPVEPGRDLLATGEFDLGVHVSHHGTSVLDGRLVYRWLAPMTDLSFELAQRLIGTDGDAARVSIPVSAKPFQLTEEYRVRATLDRRLDRGRLALMVLDGTVVVAAAVLDVEASVLTAAVDTAAASAPVDTAAAVR